MKLLVCGSRHYHDGQRLSETLGLYLRQVGEDLIVIHGGCETGADIMADWWCKKNEVDCMRVPAKWRVYDNAAGPIRNKRMRDRYKPDAAVAFRQLGAENVGTDGMIALLHEAGIPVEVIE